MKTRWFLVLILATLLLLPSCSSAISQATPEQIISNVQVRGIPFYFTSTVRPTGQWAAIYEGDSVWKIRGSIAYKYSSGYRADKYDDAPFGVKYSDGKDYYYITSWEVSSTEIKLWGYSAEQKDSPNPKRRPSSIKEIRYLKWE